MPVQTVDELQAQVKAAMQARKPGLTDFNEGSGLDCLSYASAIVAEEIQRIALGYFANLFFSTDDGDALRVLVQDRFQGNLVIQEETAAYGPAVLERPNADAGNVLIAAGTEVFPSTSPDLRYTVQADTLMTGTSVSVDVVCTTAGPDGNLAAGLIDSISPALSDPSITVSNPERMVGGNPAWTNDQIRQAVKLYYQNLRKGVRAALVLGALQVTGVAYASVDETHIAAEDGGYVEILVGDEDGNSNSTMLNAVRDGLIDTRAAGVIVLATGLAPIDVTIQIQLELTSTPALGLVTGSIQQAIAAYAKTLAPGSVLYVAQFERVAINVSPVDAGGVIKTATARIGVGDTVYTADLPTDRSQLPRIAADGVTVTLAGA